MNRFAACEACLEARWPGTGASTSTGCSSIPAPNRCYAWSWKEAGQKQNNDGARIAPCDLRRGSGKSGDRGQSSPARRSGPDRNNPTGRRHRQPAVGRKRGAPAAGRRWFRPPACPAARSGRAEESRSRRPCCDRVRWKSRRVLSIWRLSISHRAGSREAWRKTPAKAHVKARSRAELK